MADGNDNTQGEQEEELDLHKTIEALRADGERWFQCLVLVDKEKHSARDIDNLEESLYAALFTAIEAINVEMAQQPPETESGIIVPHAH